MRTVQTFGLGLLMALQGGIGSSNADRSVDGRLSCQGFSPPTLSVSVIDSQADKRLNTAKVYIYFLGSAVATQEAIYNNSKLTYDSFLMGWNGEKIALVVTSENYHSFVVKSLMFKMDASCMARNNWSYDVYLCPLGTACL